jgi:hypothetical protein
VPSLTNLPTAPVVAAGLIGGFALAQAAGIRPLGGAVLAASTVLAVPAWRARGGWPLAAGLALTQWAGMGASHPLAKEVGTWPSVLSVAAAVGVAAYVGSDRRPLTASEPVDRPA